MGGLKKYGCSLVRFTHHHASVLHASNKEVGGDTEAVEKSHALRYLSLHDNQYLQYFYGHVQKVTSLDMAPMNDLFMSSSEDRSVRLWDLRKNKSVDVIATGPHPVAAYDRQGLVFAVGGPGGNVKLYDVRSYKKPFAVFQVPADRLQTVNAMAWGVTPDNVPCTRVKFSMDGKALLLSFDGAWVMLDAYEGKVKRRQVRAARMMTCRQALRSQKLPSAQTGNTSSQDAPTGGFAPGHTITRILCNPCNPLQPLMGTRACR